METAIKAEGISKRYPSQKKDVKALYDVDLAIPAGSLFGLVGPDGAGKTTLLRILSTVMAPTSGKATVAGFDIKKQSEEVRRQIGYMPQDFSQYPDLSLQENLDFFAEVQRVPKEIKHERIEKMLEFTNLAPFRKRSAGKLSGGMKKKLALACAMVHSPRVLILDEPSTGVDPVSRGEFWAILAEVVREGVTVLASTPYMDEAERCSQVGMLYQGRLMTHDTPGAITSSLPFEVVEVKARPRKRMREVVDSTPDVLAWNPVGDRIRLNVPPNGGANMVMERLEQRFKEENIQVLTLRKVRKSMEDAFIHMVREYRGEA